MFRSIFSVVGVIALVIGVGSLQPARPQQSAGSTPAAGAGSTPAQSPAQYREVMARYCFTCHNEKLKTGGLVLEKMDFENIPAGAETWEKVIVKLRSNAMPPPPSAASGQGFL